MPVKSEIDSHIKRWLDARIIDFSTADKIREFESVQAPQRQSNWMVILAIAFGAVMLAAGVLLFVAAHWDELSPSQRFALVLTMVAGFHVAAGFLIERFRALGVAVHAIGTICLGGGIFLAGQIFNLQEHWPGGIMLWAIGALIAWLILQDTAQAVLAAMLIPTWIGSELAVRYEHYIGNETAVAQFMFMVAIFYLGTRTEDRHFARAMHILGGILLIPAFIFVEESSRHSHYWQRLTAGTTATRFATAVVVFGLPLLAAWFTRGRRAAFEFGFAIWLLFAAGIAASHEDMIMNLALYGWCALAAIAMTVWGVRSQINTFINMGVVSFALTICFFYFSSVFDKLGRSASLIGFGLMFLLGGWYLEKLRRKLIVRSAGGAQ
jgi:uncharacterized membrane protein